MRVNLMDVLHPKLSLEFKVSNAKGLRFTLILLLFYIYAIVIMLKYVIDGVSLGDHFFAAAMVAILFATIKSLNKSVNEYISRINNTITIIKRKSKCHL